MGYCEILDLRESLPELILVRLSDDAEKGITDNDILQAAIDDATAEINPYISRRVELPLSSAPDTLSKYCEDIAIYNLYSRVKEEIPPTRLKRYDDAIAWLKWYSDGNGSLGADYDDSPTTSASGGTIATRTQFFSSETLDKY